MIELQMFIMIVHKNGKPFDMVSRRTEEEVLQYACNIGKDDGAGGKDPRTIQRIFAVNEYGSKSSYEIVFEGRLKLKSVVGRAEPE